MLAHPPQLPFSSIPEVSGLYDPAFEKDACGLAMVATLSGKPGHDIVELALTALRNMEHRGAVGADAGTGDGAGIMTQIPDRFLRRVVDFQLPRSGRYIAGSAFLPISLAQRMRVVERFGELASEEGLSVLGWRSVPTDPTVLGPLALSTMPVIEQVFLSHQSESSLELDRRAFRLRKRAEHELDVYFPSLSSRTLVYKAMVTTDQLEALYPDLSDPNFRSRMALVHSRFSTNTFPAWSLAQPFRLIAHNGEINTVQGNRNWMRARQSQLRSDSLGNLDQLFPIVTPGGSDSASFDEVLELLTLSGRTLPHAMMMMIPEAYENEPNMPKERRAFYDYHSGLMEPWDGPAAIVISDGTLVCATLDRNGLRPGRFIVTNDGLVVLASEVGVLDFEPRRIVRKGRLRPGRMFLVDTEAGRIVEDDEIKQSLFAQQPWGDWLDDGRINLRDLPEREHVTHTPASVVRRQRTFGYTEEELRLIIAPMAQFGVEPIGSMGTDTPIAILTDRPRLIFDYFTQQFAQVTNPPLDSIRESIVTSMKLGLGPELNLLAATPEHAYQIILDFPVIDNDELAKIQHIDASPGNRTTTTIRGLYQIADGPDAMALRLDEMCLEADDAIQRGAKYIVLSDRDSTNLLAPVPSLLMLAAVHHHLIRQENRLRVGLIVEAGDVREVHHVAMLVGYGASAVNPYLAMETAEQLVKSGLISDLTPQKAVANIITALGKGVLKTMSKMGISVVSSYAGAQAFEALGLARDFIDKYFTGTTTRLGGVGIDTIAAENLSRHRNAYPTVESNVHEQLTTGGEYQFRRGGPPHLFNPDSVFRLQQSTRSGSYDTFRQYTSLIDEQAANLMTLRGLFVMRKGVRAPVPISEVEPVSSIVRRFSTGAMSYGSISQEAHETLAIAMNQLGARSNTGEGGESVDRLLDPNRCSAIKQVASARFGVTSLYLTNATDIQIKMAQGAKPGEGGQLPPGKVYPWIALTRNATAGVGLISPPPHHDVYSIEDLKQLIFDLKRANPKARIQVKLVSQSGIGAVASGVVKALADVVLVSGHDGGTGASPLSSLKHAGTPWELGLAETQQTLMKNGLRDRVVVQVDGQLKTGRDVIVGALLGAEEFGFATAPLVASGCVMMRVCHLDTCPTGVATQNPELRGRFTGKPEFIVNFFEFLAQEVREYLADLGFRSLEEAIGHRELLDVDHALSHWKANNLDLSAILSSGTFVDSAPRRQLKTQDHGLDSHIDHELIQSCRGALESGRKVEASLAVRNTDRAVGTMLGYEVTNRFGELGLPEGTIRIALKGTAGQSLGAFIPSGIELNLEGDANDYVGKGLSGGTVSIRPPRDGIFRAESNVIAGNVIGYGATSGQMFIRGIVGERFLVRNSGATAVVEGVGDHALEYMTGGTAVILGGVGRNLGAGMSGGTAYVYRLNPDRVNRESLANRELLLEELDVADSELLRELLRQHFRYTESGVAKALLEDFVGAAAQFVKVLPRDYAAVQETRRQAMHEGLDPDGAAVWERLLEVTGG